jgi:transcriptional regulator with XRE-family HTH domain
MGRRTIAPDPQTRDALRLFGAQIRQVRTTRKLTVAQFAARCGVSPRTMTLIEQGAPQVSIGHAFHAAVVADVPLFGEDADGRARLTALALGQIALLPRKTSLRTGEAADDDDF